MNNKQLNLFAAIVVTLTFVVWVLPKVGIVSYNTKDNTTVLKENHEVQPPIVKIKKTKFPEPVYRKYPDGPIFESEGLTPISGVREFVRHFYEDAYSNPKVFEIGDKIILFRKNDEIRGLSLLKPRLKIALKNDKEWSKVAPFYRKGGFSPNELELIREAILHLEYKYQILSR